jgi:hypothetical protein
MFSWELTTIRPINRRRVDARGFRGLTSDETIFYYCATEARCGLYDSRKAAGAGRGLWAPGSSANLCELVRVPRAFGGSLWLIRWLGPVFRIGRNPAVSLFLGRKIPDMRHGAISSSYGNGPTTVLDHFRVKFRFLAHPENTRLQLNGSPKIGLPLSATRRPIAVPAGLPIGVRDSRAVWAGRSAPARARGGPAWPRLDVGLAKSNRFARIR